VFFPLKGENRYRIVGTFPEEFSKDEGEALYAEIEQRIQAEAEFKLHVHDVEWFSIQSSFPPRQSILSGRCFLAGMPRMFTPRSARKG